MDMRLKELSIVENINKEDSIQKKCIFSSDEMLELNTLVSLLDLSQKSQNFLSNMTHVKYVILDIVMNNNDKYHIMLDTGNSAPFILQKFVTYFWSTSKLKCNPKNYFKFPILE